MIHLLKTEEEISTGIYNNANPHINTPAYVTAKAGLTAAQSYHIFKLLTEKYKYLTIQKLGRITIYTFTEKGLVVKKCLDAVIAVLPKEDIWRKYNEKTIQ